MSIDFREYLPNIYSSVNLWDLHSEVCLAAVQAANGDI